MKLLYILVQLVSTRVRRCTCVHLTLNNFNRAIHNIGATEITYVRTYACTTAVEASTYGAVALLPLGTGLWSAGGELASQFTPYALIPVAKGIFDDRESG